ncbi:MAG: VOC family protein [Jatrophihabitantaceae bacterium]
MPIRDTAWPDGTPCWIDLMTPDPEGARNFYGGLFGWEFQVGDESTGFYAMGSLGGHAVAGIGQIQMAGHPPVWTTYLAAADAEAAGDAVVRAGGNIVAPTLDVMDFGRMGIAQDPARGTFGIWQAGTNIGTEVFNESATPVWNELLTRDFAGSKDFYAAVFSYTYTEIGGGGVDYATIEVNGNTVGGLGTLPAEMPEQVPPHWLTYFAVDDVDATLERALSLGGTVQRPAADMPYGRHAGLADPAGAGFAVIKPAPGPQS